MHKTTIQLNKNTLERLKSLKRYKRQSYDETLNILIDEIEEENLTDSEIEEIQKGLDDIKKGRVRSIHNVAKDLGIDLK